MVAYRFWQVDAWIPPVDVPFPDKSGHHIRFEPNADIRPIGFHLSELSFQMNWSAKRVCLLDAWHVILTLSAMVSAPIRREDYPLNLVWKTRPLSTCTAPA